MRTIIAGLGVLVCSIGLAAAQAHDPYSGLTNSGGMPCCSNKDCGPADECRVPGGGMGYLWQGRCEPLPPDRYVEAPQVLRVDPRLHVCLFFKDGVPMVRCWMAPLSL